MSAGTVKLNVGTQPIQVEQPHVGNHTGLNVRQGPGTSVKRAISEFFKGIGDGFKTLGQRISASHARSVEKAQTTAANKATEKLVSAFVSGPIKDSKAQSLVANLIRTAGKLDRGNPSGKALSLLKTKLDSMPSIDKSRFFSNDFGGQGDVIVARLGYWREKGNQVGEGLQKIGMGEHQPVTTEMEDNVARICNRLHNDGLNHFEQLQTSISNGLDTYLGRGDVTDKTIFRSNSDLTKEMADMLVGAMPSDTLSNFEGVIKSSSKSTAKQAGEIVLDGYGKIRNENLEPAQLRALLMGAGDVIAHLIGGKDPHDIIDGPNIRDVANRVPKEVARMLQVVDDKVSEHLPGNDKARETAFVGTLFLRYMTPAFNKSEHLAPQHHAIAMFCSQVVTHVLNQPGWDTMQTKVNGMGTEQQGIYREFVESYKGAINAFRTAVLAREDWDTIRL